MQTVSQTMTENTTFPVSWDIPFDDGEPFMHDPMHMPFAISPLTASMMAEASGTGMTVAAAEAGIPIAAYEARERNYFHFTRFVPVIPTSEEDARQMGEAAEASGKREVARQMERWHGEHLPRLQELNARLAELLGPGASDIEILAALEEAKAIATEAWTIHFRLAIPMLLSMQLFDEFYADLFGGTEADGHALLVGAVSASVKAGFGISDLAILAREGGLEPTFLATPADALVPALEGTEAGRTFLMALRDYLTEYGLRQDLFDLATPTWQEDPSFALAAVRAYLLSRRDARAEHAAMATSAETALAAAREQLAVYPEAVRDQFEAMLQFARQGAFLQEEHNFYIDQRNTALIRLLALRAGALLVQRGWLQAPEDIFLLKVDELREFLDTPSVRSGADIQDLVTRRRQELAQAAEMTPPPFIGRPPAGPPPATNPMERGMLRFFGGPPQISETPGQLKGTPGSRGSITGIARVARTLEEAQALQPGEILVAITTMPPWTPLFGIASAVVTETGGPLSHCAIVAREYGIPAVVGAAGATQAIQTGQEITVDGSGGLVTYPA
ncbi:MAG: PEP-utilizing enzyme [Chloroflexota bacterium]|nr:PEP-utilizing enzyme [Chloroflexota bacterium]